MGADAHIGFHAAYIIHDGQPAEIGIGNALVGAYLARLGLPDAAVAYITQADPTQVTWLTTDDAARIGIDVSLLPPSNSISNSDPNSPASATTRTSSAPEAPAVSGPAAVAKIGPSFDCGRADTPITRFICAHPALAKIDLEFVQPYYVLRQLAGPTGWKPLLVEAISVEKLMAQECGIDPSGALPADRSALERCLSGAYLRQRGIWLSQLSGAGLQEANRPIEQHIALQAKLQALGIIPPTERIDGLYGTDTRTAIYAGSSRQACHRLACSGMTTRTDCWLPQAQ